MGIFALLRPSRIIRSKAIWNGLLGNSTPWRIVAFVLMAREGLKWLSGAGAEVVDVSTFGSGRNMEIVTSTPLTRKQARQLKRSGKLIPLKRQRADAIVWAENMTPDAKRSARRRLRR